MQANMRRIVSILLAVMFCVACFTGCGSSKDNGGTASVDVRNAKSIADLAGAKIAAQTPRAIHIHDGRVLEPADENEVVI